MWRVDLLRRGQKYAWVLRPDSPQSLTAPFLLVLDVCTGWPKKLAHFVLYTLTSSNIDEFSNLFLSQNHEKYCY